MPNPKAPARFITVTKAVAAQSQLETAVTLWFNYGDPISICALAYAAQDCYAALRNKGSPPKIYSDWFKSQSAGFQKRTRDILNFFKHGSNELTGKVRLPVRLGEILMLDSIDCHEQIFGKTTHLMELFRTRLRLERPDRVPVAERATLLDEVSKEFASWDRPTYLNKGKQFLLEASFPGD